MKEILYTNKYSEKVGGTSGYAGYRNRRRLALLAKLIPVTQNDDVLEIGPNTCFLLDAFKEKARSIVGIEINEEVVNNMRRPDLIWMDATAMAFNDERFSIVIGVEVFEHIPALSKVFGEIARVLVRGGKCYMTVPFELFRGQQALGDAWYAYRDLRMARQLHVHKLSPKRIKQMIAHTRLAMIAAKLIWIPGPSYFIVLQNTY